MLKNFVQVTIRYMKAFLWPFDVAGRNGESVMKSFAKRVMSFVLISFAVCMSVLAGPSRLEALAVDDPYTALSKATTVYNGVDYRGEYNPLYYYLNYEDLRNAFGADPNKLVEHWVIFGKNEKRVANRLIGDNTDYIVPTGDTGVVIIAKTSHDNGGMSYEQEVQARSTAKQIAEAINNAATATSKSSSNSSSSKSTSKTKTIKDVEKVAYAAGIVRAYCDQGTFTTAGGINQTAYGVFVGGEYSSAGATRALGLILDYLGITWVHKNIGTFEDQYCQVIVDGKEGYGDGMKATAGYGKHPFEGGKEKDAVTYAKIRYKFDVATQRQ